jgi:putative ATP-dependent endonuclease of the OLD family
MIIESVRVQSFRCIKDETLPCDKLTVLVGPNGSGKSSFLKALDNFYTVNAQYTAEDCHAGNAEQPIVVTVTYADLTDGEIEAFGRYVRDGKLTVQKKMYCPATSGNQRYYGMSLQNAGFAGVRAPPRAADKRQAYSQLRQDSKYATLPAWTSQDQAEQALREWEQANPDQCERMPEEAQFFGYAGVGAGLLRQRTGFLLIPAVLEASEEASEGKGSAISRLLDYVVRNVLADREDIRKFSDRTQAEYKQIMEAVTKQDLERLARELSDTLATFAPDTSVQLPWDSSGGVEIPLPKADTKVIEDGYGTDVARAGHGVQRAFLLTLLQHLAIAQVTHPKDEAGREDTGQEGEVTEAVKHDAEAETMNLILGIEEPELYQHPDRQRHLSRILLKLTKGEIKGVAARTQVIYATHSPLFVGIDRADQIRVLRKTAGAGEGPKESRVAWTTLGQVARVIEAAGGKAEGTYSAETLRPRLVAVMTPWVNEGFFSKVAVLVEGEEDRAALLGVAGASAYDFEGMGISVIPCNGKNNLDRPTAIFRSLGIPVYVVWDGDKGNKDAKPEDNHRLLRLNEIEPVDWPEGVGDTHACFRENLENTIRDEIGRQLFDDLLSYWGAHYGYDPPSRALKSPEVLLSMVRGAQEKGGTTPTISAIVDKIVAMSEKKST